MAYSLNMNTSLRDVQLLRFRMLHTHFATWGPHAVFLPISGSAVNRPMLRKFESLIKIAFG